MFQDSVRGISWVLPFRYFGNQGEVLVGRYPWRWRVGVVHIFIDGNALVEGVDVSAQHVADLGAGGFGAEGLSIAVASWMSGQVFCKKWHNLASNDHINVWACVCKKWHNPASNDPANGITGLALTCNGHILACALLQTGLPGLHPPVNGISWHELTCIWHNRGCTELDCGRQLEEEEEEAE